MKCEEAQELITGLVDNELSTQESALITAHFGECAACPRSFSREYALKHLLRNAATTIHAPTELRAKILCEQSRYTRKAWLSKLWEVLPPVRAIAVQAAVVAALLAVPFFTARYWLASPHFPIVPGIFQSYRQITDGEIVPVKMKNRAELKEELTQLVDGQFAPMAYDFSSMNIHLVGGLLQEIANRKVLVAVYQGNGLTIICYTFIGSDGDAPEIAEMFFDAEKGMDFHQFFYTHTNAVMHREGSINCILMSQMPMPELLELARAKAHSS
ncbi:MAG: zf-HC2 domain-containing protein [Candidatus Binatia bacterium]